MSPVSRGISFHESLFYSLYRLVDAAAVCVGVRFALSHTDGTRLPEWLTISAAAIIVYHLTSELTGLYRSWRGTRLRGEIRCLLLTWGYAVAVLLGIGLVTRHNADYTYESKLIWIVLTPAVMVVARAVFRKLQQKLRARGINIRRYAVCGVNELGIQLSKNIDGAPELGLRLAGFYDDRVVERIPEVPHEVGPVVGNIEELVHRARRGMIDTIYITFPMRAEERIRNVLAKLGDTTASVYIVPDFFVFELLHARWTNINGLPAVSVFENPLHGIEGLAKRAADLVFGSVLLAVAALPMFVIAAAIKLTSRGPIFFRQRRYGLDGRQILVWKFRTMLCCDDGPQVRQATHDDSRVTAVGRFLRRTSLDELPQLFNVIEGNMSLVGPRPHANAHNEQYRSLIDGYMLRHKVKPGMTGLAQVNGYRGETETLEKMEKRVACDHQYIREWSFWMDLKILAKTLGVVLKQGNAY
ncbi:MAG TPA: undecaprenyl-phosphate glucose phosphotransferase [Lacipirellulaceae bacterium]|nr:undecaprenyl-phosphate glucose phosphotransferase [Lacipirellulaceae bacterium]